MTANLPVRIVTIDADETHHLRRTVLRADTPSRAVEFDGDDLDSTFHLGALVDGRLVAVSSWFCRGCPHDDREPAYQLRGMATDPAVRGQGLGGLLLEHGLRKCRSLAAEIVWARARVPALDFYRRHGFEPVGDPYLDTTTDLPHHDILRRVDPS